jgi:phosphomannomutase
MLDEGAVIAGEGSGGIAVADFQPAFDGFLTMGLILEAMARTGKTSSELVENLPRYHIRKYKIPCPTHKVYTVVESAGKQYAGERVDTTDGIRIDWDDGWVHIRASGTEPIIRIIAESRTMEQAAERADLARKHVEQAI